MMLFCFSVRQEIDVLPNGNEKRMACSRLYTTYTYTNSKLKKEKTIEGGKKPSLSGAVHVVVPN